MPVIFQSTLSVRRATVGAWGEEDRVDISIHALREESDSLRINQYIKLIISIHALREESDST